MISYYFKLQLTRFNRYLSDWGAHYLIGYLIILSLFIGLSVYLFTKTTYAAYIYLFLAISFIGKNSEPARNDFLKRVYPNKVYLSIRFIENFLFALPFVVFLQFKGQYYLALILILFSVLSALFRFNSSVNFVIPTPFSRYPFEFITGFRRTWFVVIISYGLTYLSIHYHNFNLGIFSLLLNLINSALFNISPEDPFFVWIYSSNSKEFLLGKIKITLLYASLLGLPSLIALSVINYTSIPILLGFYLLGLIFAITALLSKYSAYPYEISARKALIVMMTIWLPFLLLLTIPFFYKQSKDQLKGLLDD